jgi:hypothetical protein
MEIPVPADETVLNDGYAIVDSEARCKQTPETWGHPPKQALRMIRPGWFVKVAVESIDAPTSNTGERFWCRVEEVTNSGYQVVVQQDMVRTRFHGLVDKDELQVEGRHIFGILDNTMQSVWEALFGGWTNN